MAQNVINLRPSTRAHLARVCAYGAFLRMCWLFGVQLDVRLWQRDKRWHCARSFRLKFGEDDEHSAELFFIDTSPGIAEYQTAPWANASGDKSLGLSCKPVSDTWLDLLFGCLFYSGCCVGGAMSAQQSTALTLIWPSNMSLSLSLESKGSYCEARLALQMRSTRMLAPQQIAYAARHGRQMPIALTSQLMYSRASMEAVHVVASIQCVTHTRLPMSPGLGTCHVGSKCMTISFQACILHCRWHSQPIVVD